MLPRKNYYESVIKKEIIGIKREAVFEELFNTLTYPVISKETNDSVHIRFFPCTLEMKPNLDSLIGTIALKIENRVVKESAISVPKEKEKP